MHAGLPRRLAAALYDTLILAAIGMAATALILPLTDGEAVPTGTVWYQLYLLLLMYAFFVGFWTHGGQTIGMRAWKLYVERQDGGPVDIRRASLRFAAAWVAWLPLGLGVLWLLFDPRDRAWHDRISRTRVVHRRAVPPTAS